MRVWQEFYCTKSGGGCGGYVLVKLNMSLNCNVEMVCPKCGHKHRRSIVKGEIKEEGRFNGNPVEEIYPTMGAWSDKPHTKGMEKAISTRKERDGVVIQDAGDFVHTPNLLHSVVAFFKQ